MGRWTPLWASVFAAGIAVAALGFAVDRNLYLAVGVLVGLVGAGGQAFFPGETTQRERAEDRRARSGAAGGGGDDGWPGEEHSEITSSPGPEAADAPPPSETGTGDGTTKGKCGECGTRLTLSDRRPVRATCPNCGHTRVINE